MQRQAVNAVQKGEARTVTETMPAREPEPTPVSQPEALAAPKRPRAEALTARYEELFRLLQDGLSAHCHPAFQMATEHLVVSRRAIDLWKQCPNPETWRWRMRCGG
jgi:hypothetical protein